MSNTKTLIKDLNNINNINNEEKIQDTDIISLSKIIIDMSLSLEHRIHAINILYKIYGDNECNEIINRLNTIYEFSGTKILEKYLHRICTHSSIPSTFKLMCAKTICFSDLDNIDGFKLLDIICKDISELPTPCKIDAVCLLMCNKHFKDNAKKYFCNIINNDKIDCDFRYKTILSLDNKPDILFKKFFIKESAIHFLSNIKNMTMYRILASQLLLLHCEITDIEKTHIEKTIMDFAQDSELDYNLRADASDLLLQLGSEHNKKIASDIIIMLGRQGGTNKTIYDNAQNVHIKEIEDSVLKGIEFISGIDIKRVSNDVDSPVIDYFYVRKQIIDILKEMETQLDEKEYKKIDDNINISMNRIFMDRAIYGKYNLSLNLILLRIWTYISSHKFREEMKKRLIEELVDMANICSSGFASKLINVISGFGDFNLTISWKDQIISNLTGRLNKRARDLSNKDKSLENFIFYNIQHKCTCCKKGTKPKDIYTKHQQHIIDLLGEFQDKILEEMTIISSDYLSRKHFLEFFRLNYPSIRNELYKEFKEYISEANLDLYFRYAISKYETGEFV